MIYGNLSTNASFHVLACLVLLLVASSTSFSWNVSATSVFSPFSHPVIAKPKFVFNNTLALQFYATLETPTGLLSTVPNGTTIYLSDDQQLDYAALQKIDKGSSMAKEIKSIMKYVGGLYGGFDVTTCTYGLWNGVDVLLKMYMPIPCMGNTSWDNSSGTVEIYSNSSVIPDGSNFTINETLWGLNDGTFTNYTDLDLYYSFNELHFGNYSQALTAFEIANSYWNGQGFADVAYNPTQGYASYKLAVDLVVYSALLRNNNTKSIARIYRSNMTDIESIMSQLQQSNGGIVTNYQYNNGTITEALGAQENGETTSLFVLAE